MGIELLLILATMLGITCIFSKKARALVVVIIIVGGAAFVAIMMISMALNFPMFV